MSFNPQPLDWAEKRAAPRKQFTARGWFVLPDGRKLAVKTSDASTMGMGIEHDEVLQSGMTATLVLGVIDPSTGTPVMFQATAEVRHTLLGNKGQWRSGLQFVRVEDAQKRLLEALLRPKLSVFDSSKAPLRHPGGR